MTWSGNQHPLEAAIEWLAPIPLAVAVSWSGLRIGLPSFPSVTVGVVAWAAGFLMIRLGGGTRADATRDFEPAPFAPAQPELLVLEERDAVLELHDRLEEVQPDSRVVRLFERPDPTPGELVDRIVDFLAEGRTQDRPDHPLPVANRLSDASASLHDALANIRASLR